MSKWFGLSSRAGLWTVTATPCFTVAVLSLLPCAWSQQPLEVKSFSVGPDLILNYPNTASSQPYLVNLPDEHTTIMPPATPGGPYLIFGASRVAATTPDGAVVLQSSDLVNFSFATAAGYAPQVMTSPVVINQCNPTYTTEYDGNYAAPGSVLQDPTLPAGNFIMLYEAENHCPSDTPNPDFYATVGFMRSPDFGKTWPAPINGLMGGPARHPVLMSSIPQPSATHTVALGNAIPSGFIDKSASGDYYLYALFSDLTGVTNGAPLRIARAKLGADPLMFQKWYNGGFTEPGIGGNDSPMLPASSCGGERMIELTRNDDLGLYVLLFACYSPKASTAAWYYSTATSLDLQDWSVPQMISGSQGPVLTPCSSDGRGDQFDGWYPSSMSPGAPAGHTKLSGFIFYHNGCDTGKRIFSARAFSITAGAPTPALTAGSLANGATYISGGASGSLVPGSWAQVKGTDLSPVTRVWAAPDFVGLGNALPTNLSGVQVKVNNIPAAVYYVDPGQVSFQVPAGIGGSASVQVFNSGAASNTLTAAVSASAPGIFPVIVNGVNYAAGVFTDGLLVGDPTVSAAFRKAKPGEEIQLYATGVAATPSGVVPTSQTVSGVTVTMGATTIAADFAGLVAVGEFQINFKVPATLASGVYPVTIAVKGVSSPATINSSPPGPVVIPVQN